MEFGASLEGGKENERRKRKGILKRKTRERKRRRKMRMRMEEGKEVKMRRVESNHDTRPKKTTTLDHEIVRVYFFQWNKWY